jgi:hypothetical protein
VLVVPDASCLPAGRSYVCNGLDADPALEARATLGRTRRAIAWPDGPAMRGERVHQRVGACRPEAHAGDQAGIRNEGVAGHGTTTAAEGMLAFPFLARVEIHSRGLLGYRKGHN